MFKKIMALINIMLLIISGSAGSAYAQNYSGFGQGTVESPYIIENIEQLSGMRSNPNAHYSLGSDINLEGRYWQPIGGFQGSLDGNGYKIKNLNIKNQNYSGLFGSGNGAILKNISIENVNISGSTITHGGGLIGYLVGGQIENCAIEGTIMINSNSSGGSPYIGGMIGLGHNSTIKNNRINGDLSIETKSNTNGFVGGMIGEHTGITIEGCEIKGKAYINSSWQYVGGLVGRSYRVINSKVAAEGLIEGKENVGGLTGYCKNSIEGSSSSLDVEGERNVGGLAGYFSGTSVSRSFATGNVVSNTGSAGGLIGGLKGASTVEISQSYAAGNVESNGVSSMYTGGIVGCDFNTVNIEDSFALGDITGNEYVGGLAGRLSSSSTLGTSYTIGEVKGNLKVGELSGEQYISTTYCYGASQKALLIKKVNGFDYETVWDIEEGATYSYLREVEKPEKVKIGKEQYEGAGTEADPYIIESKEQLLGVKNNPDRHFALINDIDLEMEIIKPLTGSVAFSGSFDGRGHEIKNININSTGNLGLFGDCNNTVIKNVKIENIDIRGGSNVGCLIGKMEGGRVENCHISNGVVSASSSAGGLIGYNQGGDTANSSAQVEVYGGSRAGGLIGYNCLGGEISGSKARVSISNSGNSGGLIGYLVSDVSKETRISSSYAVGDVGKSSTSNAGGLVGLISGSGSTCIERSYAEGKIGNASCYYAGGLIGEDYSNGTLVVENSFASGVVEGRYNTGGILGYSYNGTKEISNSYSLCQFQGTGVKSGIGPGSVSMASSYFDLDKAGISIPVEQARDSVELQTEATYENWDFVDIWELEAGSYPHLRGLDKITETIYLVAPTQLAAEYTTPVSVKLTWNNQITAETYEVSYNDKIESSATPEIVINELQPDTAYEFIVRAKNYNMRSPWSDSITVTTLTDTQLVPTNLAASLVAATCIELTWDSQAGTEIYEIAFENEILTSDGHTCLIEQLMPQTEYNFAVRSRIGTFASAWSTQLTVTTNAPAAASGGLEDPILIYTKDDLLAIAQNLDACYRLERDIDLQNQALQPIGTSTAPFTGNLNGNDHTINNLMINLPAIDNVGLFGYTNQAIVKDLELNKVDVTGRTNVGALIGYMDGGSAQNCNITGVKNVSGTAEDGKIIGQIAGEAQVNNCNIEEFILGISATEKNLTIIKNSSQILGLNVSNMPHNMGKTYILKYNPAEIKITDLAVQTLAEETQPGIIAGTGIEILSHKNGVIRFKVDKSRYTDKAWTGVLTIIKIKPLATGISVINFEIE